MSEEEILDYINMKISFLKSNVSDKFRYRHGNSTDDFKALQGILDLYKREKEKNKEAKEMLDTTPKDLVHKVFEINRAKIVNANDYIHKDKIKEKLGIEEDISTEKILSLLETLMSEVNRLEDIEDKKVQVEVQNIERKRDEYWKDKIKEVMEEIERCYCEGDWWILKKLEKLLEGE